MQSLPKKVAFKKFLQQIGFRYYLKKTVLIFCRKLLTKVE